MVPQSTQRPPSGCTFFCSPKEANLFLLRHPYGRWGFQILLLDSSRPRLLPQPHSVPIQVVVVPTSTRTRREEMYGREEHRRSGKEHKGELTIFYAKMQLTQIATGWLCWR